MYYTKAEWLEAEKRFQSDAFTPSEEDRTNLLSFFDAWEKAMAEQEKLMPMIDKVLATRNVAAIKACASWLGNSPHVGRTYLIREWRRLNAQPGPSGSSH